MTHKLDIASNGWLHALNKDPRNRVSAGFGTEVVQKEQDKFVARAWEQVKKVLDANKKILYASVSIQFGKRAVHKFAGKLSPEKSLVYFSSVLKKVKGSPTTLFYQMQESNIPTSAVSPA